MKSKKLILICTTALISVSTLFVSCGKEETISKKIESEKKTSSQEIKENERETKESEQAIENEEKEEDKKVDFSKYSDEYLVNFLNEGTKVFAEELGGFTGTPDMYTDKTGGYTELSRPFETIEKRQEAINKYYAPGVYEEKYINKEGRTYLKKEHYENHIPYFFNSVKSREVTGNNSLKVRFNVRFYYGFPVVDKNVKTVEFKEVNGELRAASLFEEGSMINAIENKDESQPCLDYKQKELYDYAVKELDGILRDDQIVTGISERSYDKNTDSKYYGINIKEPTQSSIIYFVNTKNGSIYGHYENRFVVGPKK